MRQDLAQLSAGARQVEQQVHAVNEMYGGGAYRRDIDDDEDEGVDFRRE